MNKQKLHTEIIVLCDYASISQDGKLSINGVFDELRIQKFPGGIARAFFVATINGTPSTSYRLTLNIEPSKGFAGDKNNFDLNTFTSPNGKSNLLVELAGLGFNEEGEYKFILKDGQKEVASTILRVMDQAKVSVTEPKLPN